MKKICTKCNEELDVSMFYRDSGTSDGYYPSCKDCKKGTKVADGVDYVKLQEEWLKVNKPKQYNSRGELC